RMSVRSRLVAARLGAETDSDPIPRVDGDDRERQIHELRFGEVSAHLPVHIVRRMCLGDQRQRFGPGQRGAFPRGVEGRLAPRVELVETLLALTLGARLLRVHVDAIGAAVDLRGAHLDQKEKRAIEAARGEILFDVEQGLDRTGRGFRVVENVAAYVGSFPPHRTRELDRSLRSVASLNGPREAPQTPSAVRKAAHGAVPTGPVAITTSRGPFLPSRAWRAIPAV